jgi:MFS family permease
MSFGLRLAGALWVFYGLTLGMKAGAWGFFAPEIQKELGLSAADIGLVAGVVFGGTAVFMPIAGLFIARFGARRSIFVGLGLGVLGLLGTSQSDRVWQFVIGGVLLAASTSFGGILPIQTLVTHWFKRLRSRVMAVVFTATPIWGAMSFQLYALLLTAMTWRVAIAWLAVIFPLGLLLTLAFIRNRPADAGEGIDGDPLGTATTVPTPRVPWRELRAALMSPMFAFITLSVTIATLPYLFFTTYGRMLIESFGLPTDVAVGALSLITLATLIGRLSVSAADFVEPVFLILVTLVSNIVGIGLILLAPTPLLVNAASVLIGISFGLGFLLSPILIARYFGEEMFTAVESVRVALVVGFNAGVTPLVGYVVDVSGSFVTAMVGILAVQGLSLAGVAAVLVSRRVGLRADAPPPT